jgi:hypothetical protein
MRYFSFLLFLLLSLALCVFPQKKSAKKNAAPRVSTHQTKIDAIGTAADVEALLASIDPIYTGCKVNAKLKSNEKETLKLIKSQGIKPWVKVDLNDNGYTDLLVNAWQNGEPVVYCVVDSGGNRFAVKQVFGKSGQSAIFAAVNNAGAAKQITAYYPEPVVRNSKLKGRTLLKAQLTLREQDLIEYNAMPVKHSIEKIEYSTTMCYGRCPVFKLFIDADRNAVYEATKFNPKNGSYKSNITEKSYAELIDLLNYIDFAKLEDSYRVLHTDAQTATLRITYDGGKVKTISDYGLRGTAGLVKIHELLFKLRETQEWK